MTITARSRRIGVTIFLAMLFALAFVAPAFASSHPNPGYLSTIATDLRQNPVYVDPNASPTISAGQVATLDQEIRQTGKPIYLVLIDNNQAYAESGGPQALLADIHAALGNSTSDVIGVSMSKGFYANGYNLPSYIANGAGSVATQAVHNGGGNDAVYQNWVSGVASLHKPVSNTSATSTKHNSHAGEIVLIVLGILAGVVLLGIIIFLFARSAQRREQSRTRQQEVATDKRRLTRAADQLTDNLMAFDTDVQLHPEANGDYTSALTNLSSARTALDDNDLTEARRYLNEADKHYRRVQAIVHDEDPNVAEQAPSTITVSAPHAAPSKGVRLQDPNGGQVVVNRNTYTSYPIQRSGYTNRYSGGYVGGVYYPAGWYADPFWTYQVLATDLMVDQMLDHDRDYGNTGGGAWNDSNVTSGNTGGADWSNQNTTDSWGSNDVPSGDTGGGSWSDNSGGSSYTDYSSGSDTSSYDTGSSGGSDWSSSSSDSGSSWSDSSSGGGDWS